MPDFLREKKSGDGTKCNKKGNARFFKGKKSADGTKCNKKGHSSLSLSFSLS
jgi:hypothetical protein